MVFSIWYLVSGMENDKDLIFNYQFTIFNQCSSPRLHESEAGNFQIPNTTTASLLKIVSL